MPLPTELVGLIPAAGLAKRISPLPGSKELFPIGFRELQVDGQIRLMPKVVSQYLLDNLFQAGVQKLWLVLGKGKWDIMDYYGDGSQLGGQIAYLLMDKLWGMPYTLDRAYSWVKNSTVLFGMPDTIFTPSDTFVQLLARHRETRADVTLGIFSTDRPYKLSPVTLTASGQVLDIVDKPAQTDVMNTWGCACWEPSFTELMHTYLSAKIPTQQETTLTDVFQAAMTAGLSVRGVHFTHGEYIDVGTPDDLVQAVHRFSKVSTEDPSF
ncbi:MAG: sugar phosphate nucleotidyltransferase, partial [Geitlerinemataceae cyanobacterium]